MAEDLNVALPLNYWVRDSREIPSASGPPIEAKPEYIDGTHVIYPVNTEYEIFSVGIKRHTLGAVFALNHKRPLAMGALEMMSAGICETSPSPTESLVNTSAASPRFMPLRVTPMMMPPKMLIAVITMPAIASPRTNFEAPSMAP